jgi:hypothetical protein
MLTIAAQPIVATAASQPLQRDCDPINFALAAAWMTKQRNDNAILHVGTSAHSGDEADAPAKPTLAKGADCALYTILTGILPAKSVHLKWAELSLGRAGL